MIEKERSFEVRCKVLMDRVQELEAEVKELRSANEVHQLKMQKFKFTSKCLQKKLDSISSHGVASLKPLKLQINVYCESLNSKATEDSNVSIS